MAQQAVDSQRVSWDIGSILEVYSDSAKKWYQGSVLKIVKDADGEWLEVQYVVENLVKLKQVMRDDTETVRPAYNSGDDDSKSKNEITLHIKLISDEKLSVRVADDCLVSELKNQIQRMSKDKIHAGLQNLIYKGITLQDDQRINDKELQITDERTIMLVQTSPKKTVIKLKTLQSEFHDLQVLTINSIAEVKQLIDSQLKIAPAGRLKLLYHGKVLGDDETVLSADLKEDDYVLLMIKKT